MPSSFFSPTFNPAHLMLGENSNKPYVSTQGNVQKNIVMRKQPLQLQPSSAPQPQSNTIGAQSVRPTGTGPYDAAYRQNLATYAGGLLARPHGFLGFNPTGNMFGNPVGGGNAPVQGMPTTLEEQALGGQAFGAPGIPSPQPAAPKAKPNAPRATGNWQDWVNQFRQNGRMMRFY